MPEKKDLGVKETLEVLEGVKVLAVAGSKIGADGKINTDDLKHLVDIAKKYQKLADAYKDANLVAEELGDLDEQEAIQLIAKVFDIVKAFKGAK